MNAAFRFTKLRCFMGLLSVFLGVFGLTATASASANTRTEKCLEVATVPGSEVTGSCPTFKGVLNEDSYSKSDEATSSWFDVTLGAAKYIYDVSSRGTVRIMASRQRDSTCDGLPHLLSVQVKASKDDVLVLFRVSLVVVATNAGAKLPGNATQALETIEQTGAAPAGYKGGSTFANDGRAAGQVLPKNGPGGGSITYKEWDVNPYTKGVNRGAERLVTGSDGSVYYTNDHYTTFTKVK